jgi:hypothetical protein
MSIQKRNIRLYESPDGIEADNLSQIRPGVPYLSTKSFQIPFGYFDGKMRIGKIGGIHPDIRNHYIDIEEKLPSGRSTFGRNNMQFSGRLWINERIISFWDYPDTMDKLISIIKDIEAEFYNRYKKILSINPNDWYIEVIDKKLPRNKFSPSHSRNWGDWSNAVKASLIKIRDYKGSGEWPEDRRGEEHILTPLLKRKKAPQSAPKPKPIALKQAMYSESYKNNNTKMEYVYESLESFLFEDLGNLKRFNLPKSIIDDVIRGGGWSSKVAGRESEIRSIPNPGDYKTLLSSLKEDFTAGIISVDGVSRYIFVRESERKFKLTDIEIKRKKEAERIAKKKRIQENSSNINERRGYREPYDPANLGSYSTNELSAFIKKLSDDGDVSLDLIIPDKERQEKREKRAKIAQTRDPLRYERDGYGYTSIPGEAHQRRYEKYASKKRAQIDKKVEDIKSDLRDQILNNFDKAIESILSDARKGYSWAASKEEVGKKLVSGIDFKDFLRIVKAYDIVEPTPYGLAGDPAKASRELKKLGYL